MGCASEPNRIDVKGDSMSALRDTSGLGKLKNLIQDEVDYLDESEIMNTINDYGTFIRKYSKRYGFDWRLILAIIKKESGFQMQAESHKGAFGLMQIMPTTGKSLANELDLEEVISPRNNIAAGVYLLWKLTEIYDQADEDNRLKLALAAYNCGTGRIQDAQDIIRARGGNPYKWDDVSDALRLLSRDSSNVHKNIWDSGKPSNGYFENSDQPIGYVSTVLKYYNRFKTKLDYN
jgi:membrane-bound lytic murein transglycosylase F